MAVGCQIIFNRATCAGIGLCEMYAPDVFEIADDGDGRMTVLMDTVDASKRDDVEEAASRCPTGSITIVEL